MARVIIASYLVRFPVGGYQSWMLQWLVGLQRLGHQPYFVEKSGWPNSCFDPVSGTMGDDCSFGTKALHDLLSRFGLERNWCFVDAAGEYHGLSRTEIEDVFRSEAVVLDLMRGEWQQEASTAALRVMVDGEPAFRQMRLQADQQAGRLLPKFDYYYSVGRNIGTPACSAPSAGLPWRPIFDPVVTDLFPFHSPPAGSPFTTVMSWQVHKEIEWGGIVYGQKDVEFARFLDLPSRTRVPLELAINAEGTPVDVLRAHGWCLRDAHQVTRTFDSWCDYIRNSSGEFSVCKNVFVATNSGFFSDRSAAYLASGRPVVMQDTGFSAHLPCGKGLFAVRSVEEAAAALDQIMLDYQTHSAAAREIALEHLDSSRVLRRFLEELGV